VATQPRFITVNLGFADRMVAEHEGHGWRIFRLPRFIASKEQFFESVRATLPLDPTLHRNDVWDALSDSVWGGLDSLPEDKILILWPDASRMKTQAAADFAIATEILQDLPGSLGDPVITAGNPKSLLIIQEI
jgi:hypothetical protein